MTDRLDQIIFCMGNGGVFPLDREDCEWLIAEVGRLRDESIRHSECCVKASMYDRIMGRD